MGAPDALVEFYRREHPRLVGALSLYCGDVAVAEELAAEALVRACERWPDLEKMDAPGAWVHRVAINLANSYFRRRQAARRARSRMRHRPHRDEDVGEAVAIRRAVSSLPARQRHAIVLRFYLGLSVEQTAAEMDASGSAVKSLTYRAMQSLRSQFADDLGMPAEEADDATA